MKYAFLNEKRIYSVIINANLSAKEQTKLFEILRAHRPAIGYSLDDLKGIRPLYACIKFTLKKMQSMLLTIIQK
jgi:hypothetical protein